jgi:hypothetical protein
MNLLEISVTNFNLDFFLANLHGHLWYYSAVFKNILSQNSFTPYEFINLINLRKYPLPMKQVVL